MITPIFHITSAHEAEEAQKAGTYTPEAFENDGFIHCSYIQQLCPVANARFHGRTDLVILEIDPTRLDASLKDENLEGGNEQFPHIYGPLTMAAVEAIHVFPPREDGAFELPLGLTERA